MRAYALDKFGTIADVSLRELPDPTARPGEVVVAIAAAAVNPADLKVLAHTTAGGFLHASKFPLVLGYDFSGTIAAVGDGVTGRAAGDAVYGFLPYARSTRAGTFAERVAVGAGTVGRKSANVTHEQAAGAATSCATALQALRDKGRLQAGQRVLINGASGGVGSYAVQIAKILGARVTATASASKHAFVGKLGADRVVDYKATPLASLQDKFEIVFDVASTSSYGNCSHLLVRGGVYITLLPSPGLFVAMVVARFVGKRARFVAVKPLAADFDQIAAWFDAGSLVPHLDSTFAFADLPRALERQREGAAQGKIAITVSSP